MLEGIRILDLTRYFPGPFASLRLQERGAEVIKVEDPNGDPARVMDRLDGEEGVIFRSMSRGKPCVCVNLKDPAEREVLCSRIDSRRADRELPPRRYGKARHRLSDTKQIKSQTCVCLRYRLWADGHLPRPCRSRPELPCNVRRYGSALDDGGKPIKPQIALADLVTGVTVSEAVAMGLVKKLPQRTGRVYRSVDDRRHAQLYGAAYLKRLPPRERYTA